MLLEMHLKENKGKYIRSIKKREHDKNQQHKAQDIHNGVHLGGTTSLGPGVKMVYATALSDRKSYDVHEFFSLSCK